MKTEITLNGRKYSLDLSRPLDISIPLSPDGPIAFYAPPFKAEPLVAGDFIGSVDQGSPVNFKNVFLNPHGNGTHTECVGHISAEPYTINQCLDQFFFSALLVTIEPEAQGEDRIIRTEQLEQAINNQPAEALVIRTLPNDPEKCHRNYSGTNPPYLHHTAMERIIEAGFRHLLLDLPSVDREQDEGKLLAHKTFWQFPEQPATGRTITEMIYVPDTIPDGFYLLNIQIASMEIDASPSKPVLYALRGV